MSCAPWDYDDAHDMFDKPVNLTPVGCDGEFC